MMKDRTLLYYLNEATTLVPLSGRTTPINDAEWYIKLKPHFDDLIWQYYSDRVVFIDNRFKADDDDFEMIDNIRKAFAINLTTRAYTYAKLYETTVLEYNPLWNVDGVEGHIREYNKTEKTKDDHKGNDKLTRDMKTIYNENSSHDTTYENDETTVYTSKNTYDSGNTAYPTETVKTVHRGDLNDPAVNIAMTHGGDVADRGTDKTDFNSYHDINSTDHLNELEMTIRQGNIGVTKSTDLIDSQRETVEFDFFKRVVHDCVNTCTYCVE